MKMKKSNRLTSCDDAALKQNVETD